MNPIISVIIPVYKVEKYLERCIDSVLAQTFQNYEVILIDDGSPDRCPEICDRYSLIDPRICVIHQENGGLSDARNKGIEAARGEYLFFVDSDDYIGRDTLDIMLKKAKSTETKLVIGNFRMTDAVEQVISTRQHSPISDGVYDYKEILPQLYCPMGWYYIVAWNKLYARSLFDNLRFPKGKIHEDEFVITQILCDAGQIACISDEIYTYVSQREGSIMTEQSVQGHCDWLEALYDRFEFCINHDIDLEEFIRDTRAIYFRELGNLYLRENLSSTVSKKQLKLAKVRYSKMGNKSITEKINWILFNISPALDRKIIEFVRAGKQSVQ